MKRFLLFLLLILRPGIYGMEAVPEVSDIDAEVQKSWWFKCCPPEESDDDDELCTRQLGDAYKVYSNHAQCSSCWYRLGMFSVLITGVISISTEERSAAGLLGIALPVLFGCLDIGSLLGFYITGKCRLIEPKK